MVQINIDETVYKNLLQLATQKDQSINDLLQSLVVPPLPDSLKSKLELLDLATDAVVTVNELETIIDINVGAERLFGFTTGELLGQSIYKLIPNDVRINHTKKIAQFIESDTVSRYMSDRSPMQARKKNGAQFWADISLVKHHIDDTTYITAIIRDVTHIQALVQQLQEQKSQLHLMTDNATDMICLHQSNGIYEFVSDAALNLTGYAPKELIGTNPYEYFHPDDIPNIQNAHEVSLRNVSPSVTYRFHKKSGGYVWLETLTKPVTDVEGTVIKLVTVSRDVTNSHLAQLELQSERDFISNIMALSPSAIIVVSKEGQITHVNQRAVEILGLQADKLTGHTYNSPDWQHTDYDGNPWPDEKQPFVRVMSTKQPVWDVRHAIVKPDGERVYLAINGMPMFDANSEIERIIFTVEDYTERKQQQDELKSALEREKQVNKMKSQFLSIVSHEFRTPLSIILSSVGILRLQSRSITIEQLLSRLIKIQNQVQHINTLIDDVTFVNKQSIIEPVLKPKTLNLREFFEERVNVLAPNYTNTIKVLIKHPAQPIIVEIDHQMAHFIFDNVLSNALKYSGDNGQVTIEYSLLNNQLTILVQDNGIGIPEEDQRGLFELFHRASNVGTIKGTGLGLSIVKSCVDNLKGNITFESIENQGTTFIIALPIT